MRRFLVMGLALAARLWSGDSTAPSKTDVKAPAAFHAQAETPGVTTDAAVERWWTTLADDELNRLITRAVKNNLDLQLAGERLLETRGSRRIARADLLPSVDGSVSAQRIRGGLSNELARLHSLAGLHFGLAGRAGALLEREHQPGWFEPARPQRRRQIIVMHIEFAREGLNGNMAAVPHRVRLHGGWPRPFHVRPPHFGLRVIAGFFGV